MKRYLYALVWTCVFGAGFAGCHHNASFQGHPAYAPAPSHKGGPKPSGASAVTCTSVSACDYWVCSCSDGSTVASSICDAGWCLAATAACTAACAFFDDGSFTGTADGGPGSGIGAPGDDGSGGGGGGGSCTADGDSCGSDSDCCNGTCDSGTCGSSSSCAADGDSCGSDSDCCGGTCDSGTCGSSSSCTGSGGFCGSDSDCCSFSCDAGSGTCA